MNALSNNNAAVPAASAVAVATMSDLFIELVPSSRWRERLAAGEKPSMFYSVSGNIVVGDAVVRAEIALQATDVNGGLLLIDGLTNGEFTLRPVGQQKGFAAANPDALGNIRLKSDGTPDIVGELPAGWQGYHVLKAVAHRVSGKTLRLSGVRLSYDGVNTKTGHACAKAQADGYEVVDAPQGLAATGTPVAAPKFAAAARRSAPAVAAPLPNTTVSSEVLP
jgi:hypothetical protein